jgi:DNA-binding HxlR family transcriptional regulator
LQIASNYTHALREYDRPVTDHTHAHGQSPLEEAVARVGDRWTLLVVEALLAGPLRFNELTERVRGIAPNILTSRLRGLERDGLVLADPYSSRPPRFVYELTESGRELVGALRLLAEWGARRSEHSEPLRHEACGTALEARWYCPTCERTIEEGEATDVDYV